MPPTPRRRGLGLAHKKDEEPGGARLGRTMRDNARQEKTPGSGSFIGIVGDAFPYDPQDPDAPYADLSAQWEDMRAMAGGLTPRVAGAQARPALLPLDPETAREIEELGAQGVSLSKAYDRLHLGYFENAGGDIDAVIAAWKRGAARHKGAEPSP